MARVNQRLWKAPASAPRQGLGLHGPDPREAGTPVQGRVVPGTKPRPSWPRRSCRSRP